MRAAPVAILAALACTLCAPASGFAQGRAPAGGVLAYNVVKAVGYERMDWEGDGSADCRSTGLCDFRGHISYDFKLARGDSGAFLAGAGGPLLIGGGFLKTRALTSTYVTDIPSGRLCADRVRFTDEGFTFEPSSRRIDVILHSQDVADIDYFGTHCAGPGEKELALARLQPRATVSVRQLRRHVVRLLLTSHGPFHVGVFRGTADTRVIIVLRRDRRIERAFSDIGNAFGDLGGVAARFPR